VGRSVSAFGFWGDILNGPYHAFGTVADDPRLFKITNKQFVHTTVDVAEHNLLVSWQGIGLFFPCMCGAWLCGREGMRVYSRCSGHVALLVDAAAARSAQLGSAVIQLV
jgi:hypothetical protein